MTPLPTISQLEDRRYLRVSFRSVSLASICATLYGESLAGDLLRQLAKTGSWPGYDQGSLQRNHLESDLSRLVDSVRRRYTVEDEERSAITNRPDYRP